MSAGNGDLFAGPAINRPIVMLQFRLIIDEVPGGGAWNMAVDEALLERATQSDEVVLRWYAWKEPTISLGYFQSGPEFAVDDPLHGLQVVRRLSGGGAILHHHEWTYSCVLPVTHPLADRPTALYTEVHCALIDVFESLGVPARLRGTRASGDDKGIFLCFLRGDPRDVVLNGHKIVGSAQRRRGGAVLQHGSLPLRASPHSPTQPGLRDLAEIGIDDLALRDLLSRAVAARLVPFCEGQSKVPTFSPGRLTDEELAHAQSLEVDRYRQLDWKAK